MSKVKSLVVQRRRRLRPLFKMIASGFPEQKDSNIGIMTKRHAIEQAFDRTSWAAPSKEDIKYFKALSPEQQRKAFLQQLKKAVESGVSEKTAVGILEDVLTRNRK